MAGKLRPIVIQIPEELRLTQNEIDHLEFAFRKELVEVDRPGDLGPVVGNPINTTRLAVDVQVVGPQPERASRKQAASTGKKGKKPTKKSTRKGKK
jgi:hypothetical protein